MNLHIAVIADQDPRRSSVAAAVDMGLGAFNQAAAPLDQVETLVIGAFHDNALVGGAVGRIWGAAAELQQLWVEDSRRGRGLGAQLVEAFVKAAEAKGIDLTYLVTFSFQAPSLYRRLGFATTQVIAGFPGGIVRYNMQRRRQMAGTKPEQEAHLRQATIDDIGVISALAGYVFMSAYAGPGINDSVAREVQSLHSIEAYKARFNSPDRAIWVLERADRLLGFAELSRSIRMAPLGGIVGIELERLYVHPGHHGQGHGRSLITRGETLARAAGASALWLTAWAENHSALAFYARLGFQDCGETEYVFEGQRFANRLLSKAI
jgi:diamine N-acetyltransferase